MTNTFKILTCSLALAAAAAIPTFAQPADAPPTTAPALQPKPLDELERSANLAFESNDYAAALPLLKDLAVRLKDHPDRVAPVLEKVRVCEANVVAPAQTVEGINGAPRTPHVKPIDNKPYEVTLKKLGNFDYDAERGGNIPADVTALSGGTVKLTGFMIPIDEADKISKFVLVPDLFGCCFGQPPGVQHTVTIVCPPGKAVSYYPEEINVLGTLTVAEHKDEGFITSIFEVKADSIKPASR